MHCEACKGLTEVLRTKHTTIGTKRHRQCKHCFHKFFTLETIVDDIGRF